jgi:hypothetical protein
VIGRANSHAAFVRKSAVSLSVIVSAISSSDVRSIAMIVWCTPLNIAFAWGYLIRIGLHFRPSESERVLKWV